MIVVEEGATSFDLNQKSGGTADDGDSAGVPFCLSCHRHGQALLLIVAFLVLSRSCLFCLVSCECEVRDVIHHVINGLLLRLALFLGTERQERERE